jgi:PKHD-type hydroxylase
MLLHVAKLLDADQAAKCRALLDRAEWVDGRATAGHLSERVKRNRQVRDGDPIGREVGEMILAVLERNPLFLAAALPLKVCPPLFNCYEGGETYGIHIDGSIRDVAGTRHRIRTDISATLFLTPPEDYDGGELVIEDAYGLHKVKLPAGDMVLYPANSLHQVTPVTRGARISSFFWIQSMVRGNEHRALLLDLDTAIQELSRRAPEDKVTVQLAGVYHNLVRLWSDT